MSHKWQFSRQILWSISHVPVSAVGLGDIAVTKRDLLLRLRIFRQANDAFLSLNTAFSLLGC